MKVFIQASSAITPQSTFDPNEYLKDWITPTGDYLTAHEPNYKGLLDPKLARRMSPIIKMSVATTLEVLKQSGVDQPGAIIVGTGLGCIKDTEKFLEDVVQGDEGVVSPTAFIQSTHNTVAGQIALMLECYEDNLTYVNRGHSFENALLDAMLRIEEGGDNILLGGADEMTNKVHSILAKMPCNEEVILGEGACFFMLTAKPTAESVCVEGITTFNEIHHNTLGQIVETFLDEYHHSTDMIDAIILGSVEPLNDRYYSRLLALFDDNIPVIASKRVTGEYFTASAYNYDLAMKMLNGQHIYPETLVSGNKDKKLQKILIYNHFKGANHSLSLVSL